MLLRFDKGEFLHTVETQVESHIHQLNLPKTDFYRAMALAVEAVEWMAVEWMAIDEYATTESFGTEVALDSFEIKIPEKGFE